MDTNLQKKAKELIDKHGQEFLGRDGVQAMCVSHKKVKGSSTGETAIQFIVNKKKKPEELTDADYLPSQIEGIRTDVDEGLGSFRKFFNTHDCHRPLVPGISISNPNFPEHYGTLGCFIKILKGQNTLPTGTFQYGKIAPGIYLVTNEHVLTYATDEAPQVNQPDTALSWFSCAQTIAKLNNSNHDCAIARIPDSISSKNNREEHCFLGVKEAELGDIVYKYGAKTNYSEGVVTHLHLTTKDEDGDLKTENIVVEGDSGAGDSGAVWVHKESNHIVSLLWGGNERYSAGHCFLSQINAFAEEWELAHLPKLQPV